MSTVKQFMAVGCPDRLALLLDSNFLGAVRESEVVLINTIGENGIVITSSITLTANRTITVPLKIMKGGVIVTNGFILTINGDFEAGNYTVFTATAGSQIVFGSSSTLKVLPEWFGALGDGTTDDTNAIQYALNSAATARVPLVPMCKKTYRISTIAVPQYGQIISDNARRSYCVFKANSASTLLTLSNTADTFITLMGLQLDGNATAAACLSTTATTDYTRIENCAFTNAAILLNLTAGGTWIYIDKCEFQRSSGTTTEQIKLSLATIAVYISRCTFGGAVTYAIRADTSWTGDNLCISQCTFGNSSVTDMIKLERNAAASGNRHFCIRECRFDGSSIGNSNINIGRYCSGAIRDNAVTAVCTYAIAIDGQFVHVDHNLITQATTGINITSNAQDVTISDQQQFNVTTRVADAGLRTLIGNQQQTLKGNTAARPSGSSAPSATQYGLMYMDTDLDADGKPVWWNGTAWVDATGAVV